MPISLTDAYGINLIDSDAKGINRDLILKHLSREAYLIAKKLIDEKASKGSKVKAKKASSGGRKSRAATG